MRPRIQWAYLAGKMRGVDQFNFPAFHEATAKLRYIGWLVTSPAEHEEQEGFDPTLNSLKGLDLTASFRWDIGVILEVDYVIVLPDSEDSDGTRLELDIARKIGTPVITLADALVKVPA